MARRCYYQVGVCETDVTCRLLPHQGHGILLGGGLRGSRWYDDFYRFPPYQYRDSHGGWSKKGEWRRPSAQEREACMGFPINYTKHCAVKAEQQGQDYEDARVGT